MRPIGTTRRKLRATVLATVTTVGILVGLVVQGGPAAADVDAVSGTATALTIGTNPPSASVSGTASEGTGTDGFGPIGSGFLPSGACTGTSVTPPLNLPVLLSLGLLDACVRGAGVLGENHLAFSESSAAVANVVIGGAPLGIVRSACRADGNGARGSTEIIGSGLPNVPQNPAPNTVVPISGLLPGEVLTLTLNEQVVTNIPGTASIQVNAVRLTLLGINIILARSTCLATGPDVNVATTTTAPTTTTTSGPTTTTSSTLLPPVTTTTPGGPGGINNNNTNNNDNTNLNNNTNTVTVGGDTINISTPPSQITFLPGHGFGGQGQSQSQDQSQFQQQGQHLQIASTPGGVLARTGSGVAPMLVIAALALVLGNLIRIGSRGVATEGAYSELSRRLPAVSSAPLEWGPAQIGKAMLAAIVALFAAATRLLRRRR